MGNELKCAYCPDKHNLKYRISLSRNYKPTANDGPIWSGDNKELLEKYEEKFQTKFQKFDFNDADIYVCESCFMDRFDYARDGYHWCDFSEEVEHNGKKYVLAICYNRKGYSKVSLP